MPLKIRKRFWGICMWVYHATHKDNEPPKWLFSRLSACWVGWATQTRVQGLGFTVAALGFGHLRVSELYGGFPKIRGNYLILGSL